MSRTQRDLADGAAQRPSAGTGRTSGRTPGRAVAALVGGAVLVLGLILLLGLLVTHVLAHDAIGRADLRFDHSLAGDRTSTWNTITHYLTDLAETPTVIGMGAVLFVVLRLTLKRWRESAFLAAALIGEVSIFLVATLLIHRHRPPLGSVHPLDHAPPTSSFPSGHTAAAVALYTGFAVLAVRTWRSHLVRALAVLVGIGVPVAVALSRLYRGEHYPTDVIGGAILGVTWIGVAAAVILSDR